jgi:glutamate formiminotransferase
VDGEPGSLLECVVNISEGRDLGTVEAIAGAGKPCLLDVHSDPWHNRAVLTLGGPRPELEQAARRVAVMAVRLLDIRSHSGAHPRLGVLDVVPFVHLDERSAPVARAAQHRFAAWAGDELELPCFLYGDERSLPEIRHNAFGSLVPDTGPRSPNPSAGACCVGARGVLVAYNLWLDAAKGATVDDAKRIARGLRSPAVRSLGFDLDGAPQVSCNLIDPLEHGPAEIYDAAAAEAPIDHAELVGLAPKGVLDRTPPGRWGELALSPRTTIESRLAAVRSAAGW